MNREPISLRLLIADAPAMHMYIVSLKEYFELSPRVVEIEVARSVSQLRERLDSGSVDLVIFDPSIVRTRTGNMSIRSLAALTAEHPYVRFVAYTMETDVLTLQELTRLGIGIASKSDELEDLLDTCDRVNRGEHGVLSSKMMNLARRGI